MLSRILHRKPYLATSSKRTPGFGGTSKFHDAATTQMTLNVHPSVAQCVVTAEGGDLRITILPKMNMHGVRQQAVRWGNASDVFFAPAMITEDEVGQHLSSQGFTGLVRKITFVGNENELPRSMHDRVVLLDLLGILFVNADLDGDGRITMDEFKEFITTYGLFEEQNWMEVFADFAVYEGDGPLLSLSFEDFKTLLLNTNLLAIQDNNLNGVAAEFGIHNSLQHVFWDFFFSKSDSDGNGLVSHEDVDRVFTNYNLGDIEAARKAFLIYDKDGDNMLNKQEFDQMMIAEGVVSTPKDTAQENDSLCMIL